MRRKRNRYLSYNADHLAESFTGVDFADMFFLKMIKVIATLWNKSILLFFLPLSVFGVKILLGYSWHCVDSGGYGLPLGLALGLMSGYILHEVSHLASCVDYLSEEDKKRKRIQIYASGLECNAMLGGFFLCMLQAEIYDSYALMLASFINFALAITELVFGDDGQGIFEELFHW